MEDTKKLRVIAAYGSHYEYFQKYGIDENGYTCYDESGLYRELDPIAKSTNPSMFWRPALLVGIEHNNNWTKITANNPPPAHHDEFWIICEGIAQSYRGRISDITKKITHYQYNKVPLLPKH